MKVKTIFSIIGSILIIQGILFWIFSHKVTSLGYPSFISSKEAMFVGHTMHELVGMLSVAIGSILFSCRSISNDAGKKVLIGYTIGQIGIIATASKHFFIDKLNVPLPAYILCYVFLGLAIYGIKVCNISENNSNT